MTMGNRVSTGIPGLDQAVDMLRLGDNVVWQVGSVEDYIHVMKPYVARANEEKRRVIYFRFGSHPPLLTADEVSVIYEVDASEGFEIFTSKIYGIIEDEGLKAFYVFDCLSDLLKFWYSDLMIGNFFRVACPFLFQLDTIAYFALLRGVHTHATIARIRETTQLLLDIYNVDEKIYIHPLKVWERYSPTMFFPHLMDGDKAVSITSSTDAAAIFSGFGRRGKPQDFWDITLEKARDALGSEDESKMKSLLIGLMISKDSRIAKMAEKYFSLRDVLNVAAREIGTGYIGGKSVGVLLSRKIVETDIPDVIKNRWEPHDSFYLGADIFYTYIVQNGWWRLRTKQKTPEGYFALAPELRENLLNGKFPDIIREQFMQMMEHFGQSPIIVRSSSLLEDNFGNAFAGKYESIFCVNQGTPEQRFEAFEQAVRMVYASSMRDDALAYRKNRGLAGRDEQMAILVQRVSGDHYGDLFFPHIAGVGVSANLYVWEKEMDPNAGMLRLVFGLGTRAVDRVSGGYARIVSLDRPEKAPPVHYGDEKKFSQHYADVLNLRENLITEVPLSKLADIDLKTDRNIFASVDYAALSRLRESGIAITAKPQIYDFKGLLTKTDFPELASAVLCALKTAYDYPVDIEFAANFGTAESNQSWRFNLLQCRPLQTKGLGKAVEIPALAPEKTFFRGEGNFMGGNVRLAIDYVIFVKTREYLELSEQNKYNAARFVGKLNSRLKGKNIMLAGPGRWGTTTPSLGVPVHFSEISNVAALCEVSYRHAGLMPELSFGSHFFQDIVESGIFYAAIFDEHENVLYRPEFILERENIFGKILPEDKTWANVIHLAETAGLTLYADISAQNILCGG